MISDTDWELLERRLQSIERSIEMLQAVFVEPKKYVGGNGDVAYVLQEGSLTDAGLTQLWNSATINQIGKPLVDCISTTKLEE